MGETSSKKEVFNIKGEIFSKVLYNTLGFRVGCNCKKREFECFLCSKSKQKMPVCHREVSRTVFN